MLHIERLSASIENLGKRMLTQSVNCQSEIATALRWLEQKSDAVELSERISVLVQRQDRWDGVIPCTRHSLATKFPIPHTRPISTTVIGVDGSQIYPDRHAAVLYYLIQCGALIFRYDGSLPEPRSAEWFYYENDALYDERGYLISNDAINMQRTIQEINFVAELCADKPANNTDDHIFALMDGPLLWPHPGSDQQNTSEFETYLSALSKIRQTGVVPIGYVDRPGGKGILTLLWANQLSDTETLTDIDSNPLRVLNDVLLMERLLAPGEHSPWYKRHNPSQQRHTRAGHEIWFCYVNLGEIDAPSIARIEVPQWGTIDENTAKALHTMLLHQAKALKGYPYVLARAHEQALVTTQDKSALDIFLQRKLMEQGLLQQMSEKARQKSFLGYR